MLSTDDTIYGSYVNLPNLFIYTTKIEEFVCLPNISETVAVRTVKLEHRPRVASFQTNFPVHFINYIENNNSAIGSLVPQTSPR